LFPGADRVIGLEVLMKRIIVSAAAILLLGWAQGLLAAPAPSGTGPGKELATLEKKLLGAWKGQMGCAGNLLFRADGTYEWTGYGPGHMDSAGTWKVRWDALPATLVLTCKTSKIPEAVGKITEVKLIRLDDATLTVEDATQTAYRYARGRK
jgi:hypothetical protein